MPFETARSIRPYRIRRRNGPPMRKINMDRGFPGPNGPTPWTPQLAPREGCGPERPSPGAAGSARSSRRRSRGRPRPEKGWGLALLPLPHRDARLLGGPRRLRGDPLRGEDAADPPIDRAGRGILPRATVVSGGTRALPSVVPAPLSRPLLLRPPGRTRHPHVPWLRRGPEDAARPRPSRGDAQPGRELEHGCPSPGHRGPGIPVPRAVLSARPGGPRTPEPMDHDDRASGFEEGRPVTTPRA